MEAKPLVCPKCGGRLEHYGDEADEYVCEDCGVFVIVERSASAARARVAEARFKRDEARAKRDMAMYEAQDREQERQREKDREENKMVMRVLIGCVIFIIAGLIYLRFL